MTAHHIPRVIKSLIDDDGQLDPVNEALQAKMICGVELTERQATEALRFLEAMALQTHYHWYDDRDAIGMRELRLGVATRDRFDRPTARIARWRDYVIGDRVGCFIEDR